MMTRAQMVRKENIVPISRLTLSRRPAPVYCEMIICPALEKPMATKVMKCSTSPPMETADSPALPRYLPTTTMSTIL